MSVSKQFIEFICDILHEFEPLRTRRMFSGVGIYSDERFFALLFDDELFYKVDDYNRGDFEKLGIERFKYSNKDGSNSHLNYYPVPADILEEADLLRPFTQKAIAAAVRSGKLRKT